MSKFNNYVKRFLYVWKHVTAFDCRMALIGEFLFSPDDLNRRYEEEVKYQENKNNWFKN